ncbi:MAG: V-type ATP synthase subunit I [Sulfolobales archaeon]
MPERMSLLRAIVPIEYIEEAIFALIESRVFHVTSKTGKGSLADRSRRSLVLVEEAISRLDQYAKIANVKISKRESDKVEFRPDSVSAFLDEILEKSKIIDLEFEDLLNKYREVESKISEYENILRILDPFKNLNVNLSHLQRGELIKLRIFTLPQDRILILRKDLENKLKNYVLLYEVSEKENISCILLYSSDEEHVLNDVLRANKARIFELPMDLPMNLSEIFKIISERLEEYKKYIQELEVRAKEKFAGIRDLFIDTYKGLVLLRDFLRISSHSFFTSSYAFIEGFVPSKMKSEVSKRLVEETRGNIYAEFKDIGRLDKGEEDPPTYYKLPRIFEPFKMILDLYGTPSYSEVVPIYIVALTFPIIFGLMFPDVGHGLAILIAGYVFWRILGRENKSLNDLGLLLIYLGASSIVTGFLSAEFFGPATPIAKSLEHLYLEHHINPPLSLPIYNPEANVIDALYFFILLSIRIASITMFISALLGVVNGIINRELDYLLALALPRSLIFLSILIPAFASNNIDVVGSYYYYISLGQLLSFIQGSTGYSVPIYIEASKWILNISLVWIIFGESIIEIVHGELRESLRKIGDGFMEMFDTVIMALGNSMSYLRIMGIALAHIAVVVSFYAPVLNLLYSPNIVEQISAWIIYSIGNLLAMSLEAVIAFAHTLRLHLYEMFSKFYRGQGRSYEPIVPISIIIQ